MKFYPPLKPQEKGWSDDAVEVEGACLVLLKWLDRAHPETFIERMTISGLEYALHLIDVFFEKYFYSYIYKAQRVKK